MEVKWKIVIFLAHLCALCSGSGASDNLPAGSGWVNYEYTLGGFLKLHTEPADWHSARVKCHMEGAFLASPWFLEFTKVIKEIQADRSGLEKVYSGVHKTFVEGALTIVKGKIVISTHPSDLMDLERCEVFQADGSTGTVHCKEKLPFICYRPDTEDNDYPAEYFNVPTSNPKTQFSTEPALSQTLENDCGEENLGYEFAEQTGHCYKFHSEAVMTWHDAKEACEEEGGYLAIVNSVSEVQVLKELFAKYPREKIHGAMYADTAAIGFRKDGDDWLTIDGKTLHDAGYESWRPNAPSYYAKLGFICRDGLLYGYAGDIRFLPFICEKPATVRTYPVPDLKPTEASEESETTEPINYDSDIFYDSYEMKTTPKEETTTSTSIDDLSPLTLIKEYNCGGLGYEYSVITDHCYKFHAQAVHTWYDAKAACEQEGAYLAIINSDLEAQVLKKLFERYPAEKIHGAPYTDTAAIGYLKDEFDDWVTIDGDELENAGYEAWRPDAPHPWATLGFLYRDGLLYGYVPAIRNVPYICEKPRAFSLRTEREQSTTENEPEQTTEQENYTSTTETDQEVDVEPKLELSLTEASNCSAGYGFSKQTGHCYRFYAQAVHTWYDAKRACEEDGAYLAIINSYVEAEVLRTLFEQYPADKIYGAQYTDTAAIGYFKNMHSNWVTVHGETLEEAGYVNWRPNGPHPWAKLGFIYRDGRLSAFVEAIRDEPYICEKEPSKQEYSSSTEAQTTESNYDVQTVEPNYDEYTSEPNYYDDPHYDEIREEKFEKPTVNQYYDKQVTVEPKNTELETENTPVRETTSSYKKTSELALKKTNYCEGQGYEFFEQTGRCYKFHTQATKNMFTAMLTCFNEKAELAVINSDAETLVVKTLLENNPLDRTPDYFLFPRNMDGRRITTDVGSLEDDDYDTWNDRETIHGSIDRYGRLSAIENEYDLPFICEKGPIEQSSTTTEAEFAHITEEIKLSDVMEKEIESTTEEKLEETTMQPIDRSVVEMDVLKHIDDLKETIEDTVTHSTEDELSKTTEKEFEQTTQDEFSLLTTIDELQTTEDGLPQPTERVIEKTSQDSKTESEGEDAYYKYVMDSMVRQGKLNPRFHFDRFDTNSDDDNTIVNPFEGDEDY